MPVLAQGQAEEQQPETRERRYTTREEQRDEAPRYVITDALSISGLVELEAFQNRLDLAGSPARSYQGETGRTLESVLLFTPFDWLTGEIVWEYDFKADKDKLDEAIVGFEHGQLQVEAGRLYPPFGEFFSHFATGPALEFGETRRPGLVLSYGFSEQFDLSAFVLHGHARRAGSSDRNLDWGLAMEMSPAEFATFGLSYLSDLAESDEDLLEDDGRRYARRVDAVSAHAVVGFGALEFTAELVQALSVFQELDPDRNKPRAWNAELAFYPVDTLGYALRMEGSHELEDAPRRQYGVALIWRAWRRTFITLEALRGEFEPGLAEDAQGRELDHATRFGAQVSVDL